MSRKRDEAKWKIVQTSLEASPGDSDRTIAARNDCSPTFVGKVRKAMVAEGKLQAVTIREGLDGRKRGYTPEEKEQLRQEKERLRKERQQMKRGPNGTARYFRLLTLRHKMERGDLTAAVEYELELLKQQIRQLAEDAMNGGPQAPLDVDNFDPESQGKGRRVNRKGKEDDN